MPLFSSKRTKQPLLQGYRRSCTVSDTTPCNPAEDQFDEYLWHSISRHDKTLPIQLGRGWVEAGPSYTEGFVWIRVKAAGSENV